MWCDVEIGLILVGFGFFGVLVFVVDQQEGIEQVCDVVVFELVDDVDVVFGQDVGVDDGVGLGLYEVYGQGQCGD